MKLTKILASLTPFIMSACGSGISEDLIGNRYFGGKFTATQDGSSAAKRPTSYSDTSLTKE